MDKLGLNNAPRYYFLERDPAITDSRLQRAQGSDDIAIGARIDRIKINGKKENAVVLYFSDKNNFAPDKYPKMERHRDQAAKHREGFFDRYMKMQNIARKDRLEKNKKLIGQLELGIEVKKNTTVKNADGTERTIISTSVKTNHLIDPKLFRDYVGKFGLQEIDKNVREMQAEPIDQVFARLVKEKDELRSAQQKQRKDRQSTGAEFRANHTIRAETFRRAAADSPAPQPSDQPLPLPDAAAAHSDSAALTQDEALPSVLPETTAAEARNILLSSIRSARHIARPLLTPEQILKRDPLP